MLDVTCITEGVRVRVSQRSIYNSCRFSFKYLINVLIEQKPARVVYCGLAHSDSDPFTYTWAFQKKTTTKQFYEERGISTGKTTPRQTFHRVKSTGLRFFVVGE